MTEGKKRVVIEFTQRGAQAVKSTFKDVAKETRRAGKAIDEFKRISKSTVSVLKAVKNAGVKSFSAIKKAVSVLTAPLRGMIKLMLSLKAVMVGLGLSTLKASADYETLKARLRSVVQTAQQANKAFEESRRFSVVTPFTPQQIVSTRTTLESVAIKGQEAVKAVAEASAAMKRDIQDVTRAVISMEVEPLRNLGIQTSRQTKGSGETKVTTFEFEYIDKAGRAIKEQVAGFRQAQQALLRILGDKFEGGIARMSKTLDGLKSTLAGAWTDALAKFGDEVLPAAKVILDDAINFFNGLDLSAHGKAFADELMKFRAGFIATMRVAGDIIAQINEATADQGIGKAITTALQVGAKLFGDVLLATLKASLSIWQAIGQIIGSSIYSFLLTTDLPGMKGRQTVEAGRAIKSGMLDEQGIKSLAQKYGTDPSSKALGKFQYGIRDKDLRNQFQSDVLAQTSMSSADARLTENMTAAMKNLDATFAELKANAAKNLSEGVTEVTGKPFDAGGAYEGYYAEEHRKGERKKVSLSAPSLKDVFSTMESADTSGADQKKAAMGILDDMARLGVEAEKTQGIFSSALDKMKEDISSFGDALRTGVQEGWGEWKKGAEDIAGTVGNTFVTALDGVSNSLATMLVTGKNSFKGLAQSLGIMVTEMLIKMAILKSVQGIGGMFGNLGGGPTAPAGNQFGGAVNRGTEYMTGEAGREMVVPQSAGYVIPNAATERMAGNGGGSQPIRIVNAVSGDAMLQNASQSVIDRIIINSITTNSTALRGALA